MWQWQRDLAKLFALLVGTLAVLGLLADLLLSSAKYWYLAAPVFAAAYAAAWWVAGPAAPDPGVPPKRAHDDLGLPLPKSGPLERVLIRGFTALVMLAASVVALAVLSVVLSYAADIWYVSAPVAVAFVVMIWLVSKPDGKKPPAEKGTPGRPDVTP
jgi:hypothetical protein